MLNNYEFKKANVRVYENRIEIDHKGVLGGKIARQIVISMKQLNGVELNETGIITLFVPSLVNDITKRNVIEFNIKKEHELAEELINLIKELL